MKSLKILLTLLLFSTISSKAQDFREEKKEKIKALKIAFITDELALTPEEAAKFWPVFTAYEERQHELKTKKIKSLLLKMNSEALDKMTEKDAAGLLAQIESTDNEMFQIRKKLISSLKEILPSVKILKLRKAEDEFKKKLLQQYRDRFAKD